jgi:hypothetical protein
MKKLFEINNDERQRILEMHVNATKKFYLNEQDSNGIKTINSGNAISDWQVGENLEKDINKTIQLVQSEIFKKITLKCISYPKTSITEPFVFSILNDGEDTGEKIQLNYEEVEQEGTYRTVEYYLAYPDSIGFGSTPIEDYLKPIYKNKDYKILFEKFPETEKFVRNLKVDLTMVPLQGNTIYIGGVIRAGRGDYNLLSIIPFGDEITRLGTGTNEFKLSLNNKLYYDLELANAKIELAEIKIPNPGVKPSPVEPTPPTPEIAFDFVIEMDKNFEYDSATLTEKAKTAINNQINKKFNSIGPKYQTDYLNFIKDEVIPVFAYASIDDDPNEKDGGTFTGSGLDGTSCSVYGKGKGPRYKYNQCLSEARAMAVVDYLKTEFNGMFKYIKFNPIGKGETCDSGKCWTPKNPVSNPDATYKDRRFSVNFPKWTPKS